MDSGLLIIVSISVLLNIVFIKFKFSKGRIIDALLDAALLAGVMILFSGSFSALVVGTMSSMMISIYLWFSPTKIPSIDIDTDNETINKTINKLKSDPKGFVKSPGQDWEW